MATPVRDLISSALELRLPLLHQVRQTQQRRERAAVSCLMATLYTGLRCFVFFLLLSDHAAATAVAKRIIFCEPHPISNPSKCSDGVFLYMYSKLRRNRAWKGWRKSSSEVKGHDHCKSFCKYVISLNILGHLKKKLLETFSWAQGIP